jgi:electron transfer flavoprotein beta subunit
MKILVLVKVVPDSEARISLRPDGRGVQIEEKHELNYFDELAVEEALRMREADGAGPVIAITYGPRRQLEAIRKAVAMGADEAIHVDGPDEELPEGLVTARLLAAAAHSVGFDLILCGRKAVDDDAAQVGPMVAEILGIPHVSAAVQVGRAQDGKGLLVARDYEGGQEVMECPLPALLTAQKGLNEPRVPTIQGVMKGMKLQPKRMDPIGLGLPREGGEGARGWKIVGYGEPPRRPPVRMIQGRDAAEKGKELVRILKEEIGVL